MRRWDPPPGVAATAPREGAVAVSGHGLVPVIPRRMRIRPRPGSGPGLGPRIRQRIDRMTRSSWRLAVSNDRSTS